jgi:hypothetical protein
MKKQNDVARFCLERTLIEQRGRAERERAHEQFQSRRITVERLNDLIQASYGREQLEIDVAREKYLAAAV